MMESMVPSRPQVSYSAELPDLDQPPYDAARERPGKPIRLRIQPTMFRLRPGGRPGGQQLAWPGVSWMIECATPEEAIALREGLRLFFTAVCTQGSAEVIAALEGLIAQPVDDD